LATTACAPTGEKGSRSRSLIRRPIIRKSLNLIHRSISDFAIHRTASIIGEAESILSRTRAKRASERTPVAGDGLWLAPEKPVLRILDRIDPLAKLAAMR
jgi:hypothetical protein